MSTTIDSTNINVIDFSGMTGLHTKALVATLSIGCWSGRKYDPKASDKTAEAFDATEDAGRFNKLLVDKNEINLLINLGSRARRFHEEITLPWGSRGSRILPTKAYTEYVNEINKHSLEFWKGVERFIDIFPALKEKRRGELKKMFKESDYPEIKELENKYFFTIEFTLLPDPKSDIRLSLNEIEIDKVRSSIKETIKRVEEDAVKDLWRRMKVVVFKIFERLSTEDAVFRDATFDKIDDLERIISLLNVTDNNELSSTMDQIKSELGKHAPDDLREDKKLRKTVANEAKNILDKINSMI